MYEAYWGLSEPAFSLTPDPRFLYMSRAHEDALMMMQYAIQRNKGAAMLFGDIGLGKTTISRKLIEDLDSRTYRLVLVVNPVLSPLQMLQEILTQLNVEFKARTRQQLIQQLHQSLLECYSRGEKVVVIIDEAHLIRQTNTLEELRLLLNCQMNDQFLLTLILLGQIELKEKLAKVPALEQRLAVKAIIEPMDVVDTGEMVLHRMRVAGFTGERNVFTPDAVYQLHKASHGSPRMISTLADQALMVGMAQGVKLIDAYLMHEVCTQHLGAAA
ncbi:MAG: AAA family ATPase [Armatimonadetes bacterium]|nr:AAA family ATPase [Armatimonadota bacterium]